MKKFLSVLLCGALCIASLFAFAACGNKNELPDFADCKIGYQLEVYPKVAFDYKISEDCIVHIESITATLTAKNVINEDDLVDIDSYQSIKTWHPYEVEIVIVGSVDSSFAERRIAIYVSYNLGSISNTGVVSHDGSFTVKISYHPTENSKIYFRAGDILA